MKHSDFKYPELTQLKLTKLGAEELNESDVDRTWKVGDIITVEPDCEELAEMYDDENWCEDDESYCIHESSTHCGWSKRFIEDGTQFRRFTEKVKDWQEELSEKKKEDD